jgi:hypothetical protein
MRKIKKNYISPKCEILIMQPCCIMAGSVNPDDTISNDNEGVDWIGNYL